MSSREEKFSPIPGLTIISAETMAEAAEKIVKAIKNLELE